MASVVREVRRLLKNADDMDLLRNSAESAVWSPAEGAAEIALMLLKSGGAARLAEMSRALRFFPAAICGSLSSGVTFGALVACDTVSSRVQSVRNWSESQQKRCK